MNIYKVSSKWSSELIAARTIEDSIKEYRKLPDIQKVEKTDPNATGIETVQILGEVANL